MSIGFQVKGCVVKNKFNHVGLFGEMNGSHYPLVCALLQHFSLYEGSHGWSLLQIKNYELQLT